jgi:hypothetical protein
MQNLEQCPCEEGEGLYQYSVIRYEEDHWEVKLGDKVEPTKVVYHQLSLLIESNPWLELRLQLHSF